MPGEPAAAGGDPSQMVRKDVEEPGPPSKGGNGSDAIAWGKKPVWGRTYNGVIAADTEVMGGSAAWPALSESAKSYTKPSSSDGSSSSLKFAKRGGGEGSRVNNKDEVRKDARITSNAGPSSSSSTLDQGDRYRRYGGSSRRGSYGNMRQQERGGHDSNSSRSFTARGSHFQQGHMRPPVMPPIPPWVPTTPPLMFPPPQQMMPPPAAPMVQLVGPNPPYQPFLVPMPFNDFHQNHFIRPQPYPESFRPLPYNPPPSRAIRTIPSSVADHSSLLRQIEYYFSPQSLCKDPFLRRRMDEHGWVPIELIAKFNKVKQMTNNIELILDAVRSSQIVEVQGNRIRKRDGWDQWIMDPNLFNHNGEYYPTSRQDSLVPRMESVSLGEANGGSSGGDPDGTSPQNTLAEQ